MSDIFIGRYRVIEELGRGAMGIVYRGEDPALDRPVAIKVLPPKKTALKKAVDRFIREAKVCARLDNANIVKVHDVGEEEGIYHIVMELVTGLTLRDVVESRESIQQVDIDKMADLFLQILRAMDYAHKQKVVHRDLKPENIKVTEEGVVKVMDFGLAVLEDRHSLTEMGQVMGTIAYFSPEQAKGEPADARSDLYSLGAIFFEMLTNQLVFSATNPSEMIAKHLTSPPPNPRMYNPNIPPVFANLILKVMKKNPLDRYQSAEEMIEIIEEWIAEKKFGSKERQKPPVTPQPVIEEEPPLPPPVTRTIEPERREMPSYSVTREPEYERTSTGFRDDAPLPYRAPGPDVDQGFQSPARPRERERDRDLERTEEMVRIPVIPDKPSKKYIDDSDQTKRKKPSPTAGESPVASTQWIQEAESAHKWDRYQHVLDQMKKDDYVQQMTPVTGAVVCHRCGAENDASRKYCHECGNLISHEQFLSQKEAQVHNEKGKDLLKEGLPEQAVVEFRLATEKDRFFAEAFMNLGRVLGDLGEYKKAREAYREMSRINPGKAQPHILVADLYRLENRRDDAIYEYREASRLEPSNVNIRHQMALLYSQKGDIRNAIDEYQRILTVEHDNLQAHRQLGYMYMTLERNNEAIREFEWVMQVDPDDDTVYQILGTLYMKVGRLRNAEQVFQTSLTINPEDPEALAQLGEIYEKQNREDLAVEQLSQALVIDESNITARQKLADIYVKHRRDDLAIKELETAARYQPDNPEIHKKMGDLYLSHHQYDRALQHFEKTVEISPGSAELHHKLATLYNKKEHSDLSINEFKKAVNLKPYNPEYREDLGMALYANNRIPEAISEMKKAATLDSTNLEYQKALGIMYEESDQLDMAVKQFQKVIQLDQKDAMSHGMLGRVYAKQGLLSMAIFQYQKALQLNPNSHLFHVYLGKAYAQQGKSAEAVEIFKRAIELAPGGQTAKGSRILGKSYTELGRVYLEQGDLRKAMDVLKSAEENNPGDPRTLHYMGLVYIEYKKYNQAYDYLAKALKLQPHNAEIMRDLAFVYSEKGDMTLALSAAKKSIMYDPANPEGYELLSRILLKLGNYNEAVNALDEGLKSCPEGIDYIWWLKGGLASERGEWDKAVFAYRNAIENNDEDWTYFKDLARAYEELGDYEAAMHEINNALSRGPDERFEDLLRKDLGRLKKKKQRKGV
ncbi:MAG: tetratricopeptide repeat protein [Firmicutes bacterium]|nr:tetratricopeptide repeat protein [Bacillota bacterium]